LTPWIEVVSVSEVAFRLGEIFAAVLFELAVVVGLIHVLPRSCVWFGRPKGRTMKVFPGWMVGMS
jgi:hypothetical protein